MNPKTVLFFLLLGCRVTICAQQGKSTAFPDRIVIARTTYWDIGPPFDFYDLIQITSTSEGVSIDQVLVTPHGQACLGPAKVEERSAVLHKTMAELLEGRNPCAIPEKAVEREKHRCKKCAVFSGVNMTMQVSCGSQDRQLGMNILDRDIYDERTPTPVNTSWSMRVLSTLNDALGPGSESQPVFQIGVAPHGDVPKIPLVQAIRGGQYDDLFGKNSEVSKIVVEAEQPPPSPPSVQILSVVPCSPGAPEMPNYPPIAIAARVEGLVHASFDVTADGHVQNIVFEDEPRLKMLELSVTEAMSKWSFPRQAWGQNGKVAIQFALNCHDDSR